MTDSNPAGCTECFCSGASSACQPSQLYRQQIPTNIFGDKFILTNRDHTFTAPDEAEIDLASNKYTSYISGADTYYWSLPKTFLGNQVLSYGGHINFTVENVADGGYIPDEDVIITGNGITLYWTRRNEDDHVSSKK